MTMPAKAKYVPKITYRVWRDAEQRWYTDRQLRRKAFLDKLKRKLSFGR